MRVLDMLDAMAAIGALILVVVLLAMGKFPRDLEIWAYGLGGMLLVAAIGLTVRKRFR